MPINSFQFAHLASGSSFSSIQPGRVQRACCCFFACYWLWDRCTWSEESLSCQASCGNNEQTICMELKQRRMEEMKAWLAVKHLRIYCWNQILVVNKTQTNKKRGAQPRVYKGPFLFSFTSFQYAVMGIEGKISAKSAGKPNENDRANQTKERSGFHTERVANWVRVRVNAWWKTKQRSI